MAMIIAKGVLKMNWIASLALIFSWAKIIHEIKRRWKIKRTYKPEAIDETNNQIEGILTAVEQLLDTAKEQTEKTDLIQLKLRTLESEINTIRGKRINRRNTIGYTQQSIFETYSVPKSHKQQTIHQGNKPEYRQTKQRLQSDV